MSKICDLVDKTATDYSVALRLEQKHFRRALILADGVRKLRDGLNREMMEPIMLLMNKRLGFLTDKRGKDVYPEEVVKDCLIQAILSGVYPVGNEFNIIAGNCYITKEGYARLVKQTEGLTDLDVSPGRATIENGQTCVRVAASWWLNGSKYELLGPDGKPGRVFQIVVNQYMGPDAIIGKATRKALKAVYEKIHGSVQSIPGIEDGEVTDCIEGSATPAATAKFPLTPGRIDLKQLNGSGTHDNPESDPVVSQEQTERTPEQEAAENYCIELKEKIEMLREKSEFDEFSKFLVEQRTTIGDEGFNKLTTLLKQQFGRLYPKVPGKK